MKAIRLVKPGQRLQLADVPVPSLVPNDALVRVKAAGICHSDAHYRAGRSAVHPLPLTLGHEVAGVVEAVGSAVSGFSPGDRICVHYLVTCGHCAQCLAGTEQFCDTAAMIGKHRDGGYAEFMVTAASNLYLLPLKIPFEVGAIMMCSTATAFHALKKARLAPGESVAIFGLGGLGMSAVQLAKVLGATPVFGVDINGVKLALAEKFGAVSIDAAQVDPVSRIRQLSQGRGVDVALELIGLPLTMRQAVLSLAVKGRAALAGITDKPIQIYPYQEVLNKEAEIIGVSDHLAREIPPLIAYVRCKKLDLSAVVTRKIPLDETAVNEALDELERFGDSVRFVINP